MRLQRECSGNGRCECGKCVCNHGYEDDTCSVCPVRNYTGITIHIFCNILRTYLAQMFFYCLVYYFDFSYSKRIKI